MTRRISYAGWIGNVLRAWACACALALFSLSAAASWTATPSPNESAISAWLSGRVDACVASFGGNMPAGRCVYSRVETGTPPSASYQNITYWGYNNVPYVAACGANATLTGGTTCTCNASYTQGDKVCTLTTALESKTIQDLLNLSGNSLTYSGSTYQTEACYEGYVMRGTGSALGLRNGVGTGEIYGPFTATGATCTGQPVASAGTCKPGEFTGEINGVASCVPAQGRQDIGSTVTATPAAPGASAPAIPGAPPTATTSQTSTTCTGSECTTTTTYKDGSGATVGTVKTDDSITSFCAKNVGSSICKEQANECEKNPKLVGCSELETPDGPTMPTQTINLTFAAETPFASDGACPVSASMTLGTTGKTVKPWDWAKVCEQAVPVRALVLALATLTGIFIVFGGGKVMSA